MESGPAGLTREAVDFLMAIRLNNNKPFFEENRAVYERALRAPLFALAAEMAPVMRGIDADLDTRPERVVARIHRDARYSRGILYRDYAFLSWKPAGTMTSRVFSFYFYVSVECGGWGLGFYEQCRGMMEAFRARVLLDPARFEAIASDPAVMTFRLGGRDYKRPPETPDLPAALAPWWAKKTFYLEKEVPHRELFEAGLAARIAGDFTGLGPLYDFVLGRDRQWTG